MKVLIDMNLSPRWADVLVERGIDAVHSTDALDEGALVTVEHGRARVRALPIR